MSVGLSVGLSARKVYCDKTAEWIRMPFGMVSGVGGGMGVLRLGWLSSNVPAKHYVGFKKLLCDILNSDTPRQNTKIAHMPLSNG